MYAHASANDPGAADLFASAGSALVAELDALASGLTSVIVEVAVVPVDGRAAPITGSGFEIRAQDFVELATISSFSNRLFVVCSAAGTGIAEVSQVAVGTKKTGWCGRSVRDRRVAGGVEGSSNVL